MLKNIVKPGVIITLIMSAILFWFAHGAYTTTSNAEEVSQEHDHGSAGQDSEKPRGEKKVKYWVAPMDPNYVRNEPGKSPMGMDLVPVYEEEGEKSSEGVIKIDPVTVQNIGVRTAIVTTGVLKKSIRAVGRITYDEKRVEHVHTKVSGWVEELYVDTMGEEVKEGNALLSLYSPELVATQEEYLQALNYRDASSVSEFSEVAAGGNSLVEAARKRLLFMDIDPAWIKALEENREVQKNMKIYSPGNGIVMKKNIVDGMKVDSMMELYTIADLSRVWVIASVYEYELPFLEEGQEAEMTLSYDPGNKYTGKVTFIYPYLSTKTRTVQVRMEFDNPGMKLKPDMYADVAIEAKTSGASLLVPSEAVIRTGSRNVVVTALGKGKFLPKEVTVGLEGEGLVQVLEGLKEDDIVVTSGQFLIDSESNLREAVNKMLEAGKKPAVGTEETKVSSTQTKEEEPVATAMTLNAEQKEMMSELIGHYLQVHEALISESGSAVAEKSHPMHALIERIRESDAEGNMEEIADSIETSLEGLHSGDLQKARTSFKLLSRTMSGLVKGAAREEAVASGISLFVCPMENEPWIQKGVELKNPYLGQDMWICGIEEKF